MPNSTHQPSYRKHKASGQAVVTLNGKDFYLGLHGSKASAVKYDRLIADWLANGRRLPNGVVTVAEIIRQFWEWAETHYRKANGSPTSELCQFRYTLRPLNHLYGTLPAAEFGPLKLKTVRQLMIDGYEHPKYGQQHPCSRDVINKRVNRIKLMFKWATENELVPAAVFQSLSAVSGLHRGRTSAKETEPIRPVPEAIINATCPYLSTTVRAMVDLQLLTGARPGEVCTMRACDLDISGQIWVYKPESHKNEHRGYGREIYLGPRAQEVIKALLENRPEGYLFSPQDAIAEHQAKRRQRRRTPLRASHIRQIERKRNKNRRRPVRDHYDVASYRRAIKYACCHAFPLPAELAPKMKSDGRRETKKEWLTRLTIDQKAAICRWRRRHDWHPNQLRHNAATNLRKEFGVEVARIILGHATAFTTEIYAEADRQRAMEIIGKVG